MKNLFSFTIAFLMGTFRSHLYLQLEIVALRHQLSVYQRSNRRLIVDQSDRWLWSFLAGFSGTGARRCFSFSQER